MAKKLFPFILLLLMAVVFLVVRTCQSSTDNEKTTNTEKKEPEKKRGFRRSSAYLEYTKHAKCRMKCRQISEAEVEDVMKNGKINYRKSDLNDQPCPAYALEGYTKDNQRVRIVFAQCDNVTKVVTCIDLDNEYECDCN